MGHIDAIFECLAAEERRQVCRYLLSREDRAATVEDLLVYLATERRVDDDRSRGESDHRRRIATGLRHVHLPKLTEADVVEYDPDHPVVEAGPALPATEPLLRAVETHDDGLAA